MSRDLMEDKTVGFVDAPVRFALRKRNPVRSKLGGLGASLQGGVCGAIYPDLWLAPAPICSTC